MHAESTELTPMLAEKLLRSMPINRHVRKAHVQTLAQDIRNGRWVANGETLKVNQRGELIDGQHRCLAVAETGTTIPVVIVYDVPNDESQLTIDTGAPRRFSDYLSIKGVPNAITVAGLTRAVWAWKLKGTSIYATPEKASSQVLWATLEQHPEIHDISRHATKMRAVDAPFTVTGLCYWLFSAIDQEDCDFFFDRLMDGQGLFQGDPIYALRSQLASSKEHRGSRNVRWMLGLTIKAWNKYRRGETLDRVVFKTGGARPEKMPRPE